MASMGEMIGAIAHQWKQPLNTLNLVSYSIEDSIEAQSFDRDEFMDYCKIIQDNITYMSDTINDFRNFFKQQKNKEIFPVSKSVEKIQKILHSQLTNNGIKLTFDSCNITIYAVSNELEQVFINIINNAKDTFIERNIENRELKISCVRFENQLIIKIEDNAGGIPPNIIDKIFEPYFTTKSAQDGDGLGLYMSRLIIENSMLGEINVYNSTLGAVFEIKLPILDL
jgi:C4-dicarboxylate-specific signal transduction histidine kinase